MVWDVLLNADYNKIWYRAFGEGIEAETDWKKGSKAVFTDRKGNGLFGKIVANDPDKLLSIEYLGEMANGREVYDSEGAAAIKGGRETYKLTEKAGETLLEIAADMHPDYYDMMLAMWQKALLEIKALAESIR